MLGLLKKRKKAKTGPNLTKSESYKATSQETPNAQPVAVSLQTGTQGISVVDTAAVGA